jgi:hypothetical protein
MLRKVLLASFTLAICVGLSLAGEFRGVITKVDGNKVTFYTVKKKEKGEPMTLPVASNVKVSKGKYNKDTKKVEATDAIEGGLKAKPFTNIGEKGVPAFFVTDADNTHITEIILGGKGGKKKKNQ